MNVPSPSTAAASAVLERRLIACPSCGLLQSAPSGVGTVLDCRRCGDPLERGTGRSLDAALACAASTLLLLLPANILPFLSTATLGVSRESRLLSGSEAMWADGQPLVAVAVGVFVVVAPFLRFGLLTVVLGALRLRLTPHWLGAAFRVANGLQTWAMMDVLLLALWVSYARLAATLPTHLGGGAYCAIAAGLLSLFTRATLDEAAVWNRLAPDVTTTPSSPVASCAGCGLVRPSQPDGGACPRCEARVHPRRTDGLWRAAALTAAGAILYLPANIYPMATLPIQLRPTAYTVLQGVIDLVRAKLLGLAALVFTASFVIPFLKLAVMALCIVSVLRRSSRFLRTKTSIYRVVEEVGRWSMVDPLVIACFVPVTQYSAMLYGRADAAASFFTAVVVLTMVAANQFDPRLMWDAARRRA